MPKTATANALERLPPSASAQDETPPSGRQRAMSTLPMRAVRARKRSQHNELASPVGPIRSWPARERPRERMQTCGVKALSDGELLALFVRTGTPGHSAVEVGRALMRRFGSLNALLHAEAGELNDIPGIGPAKISQLQAVSEIVQRSLAEEMVERPSFDCPEAVGDYVQLMIGSRPYEVFVSLYLDSRHRLLRAEESSRGTLTQTAVYPREIVRNALHLNAAGLIVSHNHPSGDVAPSDADHFLTRRLRAALDLVDIKLWDHLIVSAKDRLSFAEHGWL